MHDIATSLTSFASHGTLLLQSASSLKVGVLAVDPSRRRGVTNNALIRCWAAISNRSRSFLHCNVFHFLQLPWPSASVSFSWIYVTRSHHQMDWRNCTGTRINYKMHWRRSMHSTLQPFLHVCCMQSSVSLCVHVYSALLHHTVVSKLPWMMDDYLCTGAIHDRIVSLVVEMKTKRLKRFFIKSLYVKSNAMYTAVACITRIM